VVEYEGIETTAKQNSFCYMVVSVRPTKPCGATQPPELGIFYATSSSIHLPLPSTSPHIL
jgi:hypothetical protein